MGIMKIEISTICNYASNKSGSLTIVDTIDVISADKFPCKASFCFAAKINMEDVAKDYKTFVIQVVDIGNKDEKLFEASGPINNLGDSGKPGAKIQAALNFNGLIFNREGDYKIRILLDGEPVIDHPFKVALKK